jgi:hypothetical protein
MYNLAIVKEFRGNDEFADAVQVLQVQEAFPGLQGRPSALWIAAETVKNVSPARPEPKSRQGFLFEEAARERRMLNSDRYTGVKRAKKQIGSLPDWRSG